MFNVPTSHISAQKGEIAKTVLMPGDPLRAKFIAENFLTNVKCFNTTRNMYGFTGEYNGKTVSVMGSGMGMPSIGLYSYELYNFYDVESIIRVGSAGTIQDYINLEDIVIAMGACTDSNYCYQHKLDGNFAPIADYGLLKRAEENSKNMGINTFVGNICSSDVFYCDEEILLNWSKMGVLAVEMEAAALYINAAKLNKKALCILTVSDCIFKGLSLSAEKRQIGFNNMIKLALDTAIQE